MIGSEVDYNGNLGTEFINVDKLEIGNFKGNVMSALLHKSVFHNNLAKRDADVSAKVSLAGERTFKDLINKGCSGRFAVCARDSDIVLRLCDLIGKLDFGDNRNIALGKSLHSRTSERYARIFNNEVKVTLENLCVLSDDFNSVFVEEINLLDFFFLLALRKGDYRTELFQHPDRRHTASCKSDDENLLP